MATYMSPGVYVEEISTLPPSVAEVATAIPAFIGYTEKTGQAPTRISSMIEYKEFYGGPPDAGFNVTVTDGAISIARTAAQQPLLYYSLRLYFDNGGGPCYIVSVGDYAATPSLDDFKAGLDALKEEDEPTLIVMPDATRLSAADSYLADSAALDHCGAMKDRFAILDLDVKDDVGASDFRDNVSSNLDYGAAYTPHLNTALTYAYDEAAVTVTGLSAEAGDTTFEGAFDGITVSYTGASTDTPTVEILLGTTGGDVEFATEATGPKRTITLNVGTTRSAQVVADAWPGPTAGFDLAKTGEDPVGGASETSLMASTPEVNLGSLKAGNTALHAQINTALGAERVTLPPSPAIAGIYARVDRERGVWKAPANVAVASVISLTQTITDQDQDNLNIDATSGKSINAIRSFTGRGTLVWGARTLAGNDNEWRYVPVRRLFIMIEESTQKATAFAVFEPNDAGTWLKVKAMIESYLYGLWQQGALAGSTPETAYFVNVGLGKTMTTQDILEGRMIVEIGIAAVRPAEFIILRFTHKMQEA